MLIHPEKQIHNKIDRNFNKFKNVSKEDLPNNPNENQSTNSNYFNATPPKENIKTTMDLHSKLFQDGPSAEQQKIIIKELMKRYYGDS